MYRVKILFTVALLAFVAVAGLRCGSDSPAGPDNGTDPEAFKVELEDYTDGYDDEAGGMLLKTEACVQASGGSMVRGLDYPGEWIDVPITVEVAGTYELTLRYATLAGDTLRVTVAVGDCGGETFADPEVDFVMDQGMGLG